MQATIFPKASNEASQRFDGERITLDAPSVVVLPVGPEHVASFDREGNDLILVLQDGSVLVIANFFVITSGDRNDLVFEDENGVTWWAQYDDVWTGFNIAEINDPVVPPPFPWLTGLGLLAGGAALAGGGGGGGGGASPNRPPEGAADPKTTPEDTPVTGKVTGDDPDGDPLTFKVIREPKHGTVSMTPDGNYTYTPNKDYNGPDDFEVIVEDPHGGTSTITVPITVTPVNDPVTAGDDNFTTAEDTRISLDLLDNDEAPDGGLRITTINGQPVTPGTAQSIPITDDGTPTGNVIGKVEITPEGDISFMPEPNYNGPVEFEYEVRDDDGDTDTAKVDIDVTPDDPPTIVPVDHNGGTPDPADPSQPTIEQGHVTVHESGLPGGSTDGDGSSTATGTITVEAGDGVKTVTIGDPTNGGKIIPLADLEGSSPTSPIEITTPNGTLTITGYTPNGDEFNDVSTGGTINYEYTLTTPPSNTPNNPDNFIDEIPVSIEDEGGETTSGSLQINIIDDEPTAEDDAVTTDGGTAEGNVITGAINTGTGTPSAPDVPGADGPLTVTDITSDSGNTPTKDSATGNLTIEGEYGTLEIRPDGSYTYTRTPGSAGGGSDVFTYTVTDDDGDTDTATLTITIPDEAPSITPETVDPDNPPTGLPPDLPTNIFDLDPSNPSLGQVSAVVYEGALEDGSDPDSPAETTTGRFTFTSVDGVRTLTVGGTEIQGFDDAPITFTTPEGNTLTITNYTYDPTTGEGTVDYHYTLTGGKTHTSAGNDTLDDTIPVELIDNDGDTSNSNIVVRIIDDQPLITEGSGNPQLEVDESNLASPNTVSFSDLFNIRHGADGEASSDAKVYSLTVDSSIASGLKDTQTGDEVVLSVSGNTVTGTAGTGGPTVFTLEVDPATGEMTLTQQRAVEHSNTADPDDVTSLAAGAVTITVRATDGDGDEVEDSASIGDRIRFRDDGPTITSPESATVDESHFLHGSEPDPDELTQTGTFTVDYGGDGEGPEADLRFSATQSDLAALTLRSGGAEVEFETSADGKALIATANGETVFTVTINEDGDGYEFVLAKPLDHGSETEIALPFELTVTDGDGDTASASFTVTVLDDAGATETEREMTVTEDSEATINTTADANVSLPEEEAQGWPQHGTISVNPTTGQITYTPDSNYSGTDTFTYTVGHDDGTSHTTTVTVTVTPVADAPELDSNSSLTTNEDTSVTLGLTVPRITDNADGNGDFNANDESTRGDHPERLEAITLTLRNADDTEDDKTGAELTKDDGTALQKNATGGYTIVIVETSGETDVDTDLHLSSGLPTTDVNYLTRSEYEALMLKPGAERHENVSVHVSATSREVDDSGAPLTDVDGASSKQTITVNVQAVTDGATLTTTATELSFDEDSSLDLSSHLSAELGHADHSDGNTTMDEDGSERYSYTVSGLPEGTVVTIDGKEYPADATGEVTSDEADTLKAPDISITPPPDFSGNMGEVTITLKTRDTDDDSPDAEPETIESSVTLTLNVTPVAGDVAAEDVTTDEDTAVNFLAGVRVTDTGTENGTEVIDSVSFTVPDGWTLTPSSEPGWSNTGSDPSYTITFDDGLTEDQREAILDGFTIQPPAHSSEDATITLSITSTDTNGEESDTQTVERDVTITVEPIAERTDSDSDVSGDNDVTMNGDHQYTAQGKEDEWFALGTNYTDTANQSGGQALATPWSNADPDEFTYAVLTPTLTLADDGDTVNGTEFRYSTDGGSSWEVRTFAGDPVWVPAEYLDTLQVKLPPDVSGRLEIRVQAGTVDYDDDTETTTLPLNPPTTSGDGVNVDVSGEATLRLIDFTPVADAVTMALNGRASGLEDTPIPLSIKTTSSDPSETFNVTISGIPEGATITYGTEGSSDYQTFTAGPGNTSWEIEGFDNDTPITITPPKEYSGNFSLQVSAVSVDENGTLGSDTLADPVSRTINVSVTGVADETVITLPDEPYETDEATLDAGDNQVALSDLIASVTSPDDDGSETLSLRITGLAEDFSLSGATPVVSGSGEERVWVAPADALENVFVVVPENHSGTVSFKVAGVTTEGDGDSHTAPLTDVSFTITPSPEATITQSATLTEDEITPLDLDIAHENGDTDETLGAIYVPTDYDTSTYTLYFGEMTLDTAELTTEDIAGVEYYVIPAGEAGKLGALGAEHLDGTAVPLHFLYDITDPSSDGTLDAVTERKTGSLELTITPVTDPVTVSIDGISMTAAGSIDDATPDTATVTSGGEVTVNLHVESPDDDGSEHLIRVLIEGVPDGVTVEGAAPIGEGSWLFVYDAGDAKSITSGGINVPVVFDIGEGVVDGTSSITMTVQAQDRGNQSTSPASLEEDSVSWNLELDLTDGEPYVAPSIDEWAYNDAGGTEDTSFTLNTVINAAVSTNGDPDRSYTYTVSITDLPPGTVVNGMTQSTINGEPVWTATTTVQPGENSQTALDTLLESISIRPPDNSNDNNADFSFDARLAAAVVGGPSTHADATVAEMPITPVTDEATLVVTTTDVDEGGDSVTATIAASMPADGEFGTIVDGKLYVQVSAPDNPGGSVSSGGQTYTLESVSGVDGVPDGDYYVIDIGESGGSVELTYTVPEGSTLEPGEVEFTVRAQTQETRAANTAAAEASGSATVQIANNGVTGDSLPASGEEPEVADREHAIPLNGLTVSLNDDDGSETIRTILLSGVPDGFLLYVGNSAEDAHLAEQASNAGGDGTTNTWVVSDDGELPGYVAILPPANWSGTLSELALVVESGESDLSTTRVDKLDLEPVTVTPVANGLEIDPTISFGVEGEIIALNLNAAMNDPAETAAANDSSTETTTLKLTGLGEHAAFYVGGVLYESVTYDAATGAYTITGLSQQDLDKLGFVQAASALDGGTIDVEAWTVESGAPDTPSDSVTGTLEVNLRAQLPTSGDDTLIWTGEAINSRGGEDTVALRLGENLSGSELADQLSNVEVLDLNIAGANAISDLTAEQVATITGGGNALTIKGSAEDSLTLSGDWTDNGGGSYSGADGVTLTVEGVSVEMGTSAFTMSFSDTEGFGLASLDADDAPEADAPASPPVSIDEVLASSEENEDLTSGLPEENTLRDAPGGHAGNADLSSSAPAALEDELLSGVLYEV